VKSKTPFTMLALDSPEWANFDTYFDEPEELPGNLCAWRDAFGTSQEEEYWFRLRDQFLHQGTIKDAAIAIVPHICALLPVTPSTFHLDYAVNLAQAHMAWRRHPITSVSPELAASYEASIVSIRPWVSACLLRPLPPMEFRYLLSACATLCGHPGLGSFLFELDGLSGDFPDLTGYI
jgi:hypothetical protein